MEKLLIKYLEGNATPDEIEEIFNWVDLSEENKEHLMQVKTAYMLSTVPNTQAEEERVESMMSEIRQRAAKKRKDFYRRIVWLSASISAAAVIVCASISLYLLSDSNKMRMKECIVAELTKEDLRIAIDEMPEDFIQEIYTDRGVKSSVVLPDSSVVLLNSDTKIRFPRNFAGSCREIFLDGEAYFKVKPNPCKPMIVNTSKNFEVRVLGTEFNLKAFKDDAEAEVTLYSGKIDIVTPYAEQKMEKAESVVIKKCSELLPVASELKLSNNKAWTEGKIIFNETSMKDVITTLERWHGVEFVVKDTRILKYRITALFNSESISQILHVIHSVSMINYSIEGNVVTLSPRKFL